MITVRCAEPADDLAWDEFVTRHPAGSPFHTTRWRDQVLDVAPHAPHFLIASDSTGIRGVLPLFHVRSPLAGNALVSTPYGVYGGILACDDAAGGALLEAAGALAASLDASRVELRHVQPVAGSLGAPLARSDLYVTFVKDLPADPDGCLEMIPRKSRASTRNARDKHGMEFVSGPELLPRFYDLFVANKAQLGSPAFSRDFFANLLIRFGDAVRLDGVRLHGEVIAAVISFAHRDTLNPYWSGSQPGTERLGSMNFMYWQTMEAAVRAGLRRYDFGRSRVATGAYAFKRNMGFEPTPLAYQYLLREGAHLPSINPSNPRFEKFQELWRRLPPPLLKVLGPILMRHLP